MLNSCFSQYLVCFVKHYKHAEVFCFSQYSVFHLTRKEYGGQVRCSPDSAKLRTHSSCKNPPCTFPYPASDHLLCPADTAWVHRCIHLAPPLPPIAHYRLSGLLGGCTHWSSLSYSECHGGLWLAKCPVEVRNRQFWKKWINLMTEGNALCNCPSRGMGC